jgi:hypothetical protein
LAEACLLLNWNDLPVERDPSKTEYKSYGGYGGYGWDDYDYDYSNRLRINKWNKRVESRTDKVFFCG